MPKYNTYDNAGNLIPKTDLIGVSRYPYTEDTFFVTTPDQLLADPVNEQTSATSVVLTNPMDNVQAWNFTAPGQSLTFPVTNVANSIPVGSTVWVINDSTTIAYDVKLSDGTTVISGLQPDVAAIMKLENNNTANGNWAISLSGTLGQQQANQVAISGGNIDGTAIGNTTPSSGKFTTLQASTPLPIASGGTNANNATNALSNLGGQPLSANLTSIAGISNVALGLVCQVSANTFSAGNLTGDITTSGLTATLPNIVTAGTNPKITYNAKGQVTGGAPLVAGDIPNIAESQVTNLVSDLAARQLITQTVLAKTTSFAMSLSDNGKVYDCNGSFTITFQPVSSAGSGFNGIANNTGTGIVILGSADNINGTNTYYLMPGQSVRYLCDGTTWWIQTSTDETSQLLQIYGPTITTYTLRASEYKWTVWFQGTNAVAVTIPSHANLGLPQGYKIKLRNGTTKNINIAVQGTDTLQGIANFPPNTTVELTLLSTPSANNIWAADYFVPAPSVTAITGAYTLKLADFFAGYATTSTGGSYNITLPQTSTEIIPAGIPIIIKNINSGAVTFVIQGSDTINGNVSLPSGCVATITKRIAGSPNTWDIYVTPIAIPSAFQALLSSPQPSGTGDGTENTVPFDTVSWDLNNEYNNSTNIFTAKESGIFTFGAAVLITNIVPQNTGVSIYLVTSSQSYLLYQSGNAPGLGVNSQCCGSVTAQMSAGDTAYITVEVDGNITTNIGLYGDPTYQTGFWGNLEQQL